MLPRFIVTFLASSLTALLAIASPGGAAADESAVQNPGSKPVITRKDDLPRHSYQLDLKVTDLYLTENRAALLQKSIAN